jgi:thymidylate synthase
MAYTENTVKDIRQTFKALKAREAFITDKTGVKTLEIVGASFIADEETIFGPVNWGYVERELEWYESESLNVNDIPGGPPKIWKQVATPSGEINSNYGWCIGQGNGNQLQKVYEELSKNPNSRRAQIIYTRPSMWEDYNRDGMSDFMCTNVVQYLIRNNKLHCVVQMRSNDAWAGYRNDRAWQDYVLLKLATMLNIEKGNIYWMVGSLHIYEPQFDLIQ